MFSAQRNPKAELSQVNGFSSQPRNRSVLLVFDLVSVVALSLGLFYRSNEPEAQTPAAARAKDQPPTFLTIENPTANPGQFLMQTFEPSNPDALSAEGYRFVSIRGVIDWKAQKRILSAEPLILDFEIQRQEAKTVEDPWGGEWVTLEIDNSIKVLQKSFDFEQDPVAESLLNPVITMPLPRRVLGIWEQYATHPDLKGRQNPPKPSGNSENSDGAEKPPEGPPEVKLFRFFDFAVTPGAVYRYRVRIKYRNPFFGKPAGGLADKSLAEGLTKTSDWSEPTPAVQVLPNTQFYLTDVEYARRGRTAAVLDIYKWNAPTGTYVNAVHRFGVGDEIGGTIKSKVVDPLHQTYVAQDINFGSGDVLIDIRGQDELRISGTLPDLEQVPNGVLNDEILIMNSQGNLRVCDRMTRENERVRANRYQQFQNELGKEYERAARRN